MFAKCYVNSDIMVKKLSDLTRRNPFGCKRQPWFNYGFLDPENRNHGIDFTSCFE